MMKAPRSSPRPLARVAFFTLAVLAVSSFIERAAAQPLPPVPVPPQNPITEPKRVLGKILFWDEQLSSDDTIACGTCHLPVKGGGDDRVGTHPGPDGVFGNADDILGSPGRAEAMGRAARARVERCFQWSDAAAGLVGVFEDTLRAAHGRSRAA